MAEKQNAENNSVTSRITLFNQQVEQHREWQRVNPFSHYSIRDMPKPILSKEEYGTAPAGSLSEQRALQARVTSLQEMLQLCELINDKGKRDTANDTTVVSIQFGELFELYNDISDKLLGTLLCARKHKYLDFVGEALFQGRDDSKAVCLLRTFEELQEEIVRKIENLRCMFVEKPVEHPELRDDKCS